VVGDIRKLKQGLAIDLSMMMPLVDVGDPELDRLEERCGARG
jgi:hypothetical protein